MAKQIFSNKDDAAKQLFRAGINKTADAVGSTMGAAGKTVVISNHLMAPPFVTKDGVTVANNIMLDNHVENMGAQMIRQVSAKTAKDAGDGTTQTAVLAQSIIAEGFKHISAGANPQELKSGIEKTVNAICGELKSIAIPVDDNEKIKNIATVSANNDTAIGDLIADAYSKIGNEGLLLIEESGTIDTFIEVVEGVEIARGYISPHFANNKEKMQANYENPLFLVTDYDIKTMKEIAPIFAKMSEKGWVQRGIIIFAQDYQGEVFSSMVQNNAVGNTRVVLAKAPAQYRKETLEDIAVVTGATMISDEAGIKMENIQLEHLGSSDKVIVGQEFTRIIGGHGKKESVDELKHAVKTQMDDMKNPELKEVWRKRLGRISANVGIIKVGGATDIEVNEKKDRVDDACRAVKSAIEEGVVVGGGVALLRCRKKVKVIADVFGDESMGCDIIRKACEAPLNKMLENAGLDKSILREVDAKTGNMGYNIKTKASEDLYKAGVIDPAKVIRCALQNAASVACAVLTSDYFVVEIPKE
jgi:chaperonin GroEL